MVDLSGKNIVLGVTGGIAAYKAAELCRLFVKAGATVRVVMTDAATHFITPLTMQTLSGAPVALNLFDADQEARIGHIRLGDDADLIVIAPATANSIARLAAGGADDLLSAVVLASRAPVLLAPAMNVNMWQNPLTQQNLGRLLELGRFQTVGPDAGALACGWVGEGRLIEPMEIAAAARRMLTPQDLAGMHVVVTAGPTFEPIDDVRFIGNRSSGKMGFAMADAAASRGAQVTLIAGPVTLPTPAGAAVHAASRIGGAGSVSGGIFRQDVESAAELRTALLVAMPAADVLVMTAAVADFRPANRVTGKLSRRGAAGANQGAGGPAGINLPLLANPDLLAEVSRGRRDGRPMLVGFAAEVGISDAGELIRRASAKLAEKDCDVVIANDVGDAGLGFGSDENAVTLVYADGGSESLPRAPKSEIAQSIWDRLLSRLPASGGGAGNVKDNGAGVGRGLAADSRSRGSDSGAPAGRREEGGGSHRRSPVVRPPTVRTGSSSRRRRA